MEEGRTIVQEDPGMADVSAARLEKLLRRLGDDDPVIRVRAASLISALGPAASAALPILLELLADSSAQSRKLAAWTLGNLGQQAVEAVPALRSPGQNHALPPASQGGLNAVVG
jgi:HEAT repeat protein